MGLCHATIFAAKYKSTNYETMIPNDDQSQTMCLGGAVLNFVCPARILQMQWCAFVLFDQMKYLQPSSHSFFIVKIFYPKGTFKVFFFPFNYIFLNN